MAQALSTRPAMSPSREAARRDREPRSGWRFDYAVLGLLAAVLAVESLLAFRVWAQLTGDHLNAVGLRFLYSLSSELTLPFRGLETTTPVDADRALELSTVVAIEAYLVFGALLLGLLLLTRRLVRSVTPRNEAPEPRGLPVEQPARRTA